MSLREDIHINDSIVVPYHELEFAFVASSGPGGQNVNKVATQAQLSWDLEHTEALPEPVLNRLKDQQRGRINKDGALRIDSQRYRDRERNREDCLEKLRKMLVAATISPVRRRKTRVPKAVKEKRLREKRQRAETKQSRRPPKLEN